MVEVFKTNVEEAEEAGLLIHILIQQFPGCKINFDLEDCDKILRIEGNDVRTNKIIHLLKDKNYSCVLL